MPTTTTTTTATASSCAPLTVVVVVVQLLTSSVVVVADLPRVLSQPGRRYLARGMPARLDCPADANPPVTEVRWTKDGRPLQGASPQRQVSNASVNFLQRNFNDYFNQMSWNSVFM